MSCNIHCNSRFIDNEAIVFIRWSVPCQIAETVTKAYEDQTIWKVELFHEGNALAHVFDLKVEIVVPCFELVDQPPYSPVLAPSDMKIDMTEKQYCRMITSYLLLTF